MKLEEMIGLKFGAWKVLSVGESRSGPSGKKYSCLNCICECGAKQKIAKSGLTSGKTSKCKKCYIKSVSATKDCSISKSFWTRIVNGAIWRNLEISIDREWAYQLFLSQNKKCRLSDLDLTFPKNTKEMEDGDGTASLDRIDSNKGYIPGNVQWVHKFVNKLKTDFPQETFLFLCKKISNHKYEPPPNIDISNINFSVPKKRNTLSKEIIENIKKDKLNGMTYQDLKEKYKVSSGTIYRYTNKLGVLKGRYIRINQRENKNEN